MFGHGWDADTLNLGTTPRSTGLVVYIGRVGDDSGVDLWGTVCNGVMVMVMLEWATEKEWHMASLAIPRPRCEFEKVHCHVWRTERAKSLECVRCGFDEAKIILVETQHGCIENQCLNHRPAAAAPMKRPSCLRARKRRSHGVAQHTVHVQERSHPATRDVSKQSELQVRAFPSRKWNLCLCSMRGNEFSNSLEGWSSRGYRFITGYTGLFGVYPIMNYKNKYIYIYVIWLIYICNNLYKSNG